MSARPDPFKVHIADQVLAALAETAPLPLSTPAIQDRTGYGMRYGEIEVPQRLELLRPHAQPPLAALAAGEAQELGAALLGNDLKAALRDQPRLGLRCNCSAGTEAGALAGIVSGSGPTCASPCVRRHRPVDIGTQLAGAGVCLTLRAGQRSGAGCAVSACAGHRERDRGLKTPEGLPLL